MTGISAGYFRVDQKGIIKAWDENTSAYLGYSAADILGKSLDVLIPGSYRERHWKGFHTAMTRGFPNEDQPALNVPLRHADGKLRLYPVREVFLRDPFGQAVGLIVVIGPEKIRALDNGLPSPFDDALDVE